MKRHPELVFLSWNKIINTENTVKYNTRNNDMNLQFKSTIKNIGTIQQRMQDMQIVKKRPVHYFYSGFLLRGKYNLIGINNHSSNLWFKTEMA